MVVPYEPARDGGTVMVSVTRRAARARQSIAFRARRNAKLIAWWLRWGRQPYVEYHRHMMDKEALTDPAGSIGGLWDVLGPLLWAKDRLRGLPPA